MTKPIGGFFELELPAAAATCHPGATALSTGRACLRMMLQHLTITKCYLPFYTCDAVYQPFIVEDVPYDLYELDERMEPAQLPELEEGEYFLYINYFGVKSSAVEQLIAHYGSALIIDNTHLFFHKGYPQNWSFTSARKYFGVPDGAYLYSPQPISAAPPPFQDISLTHNTLRLIGRQQESHQAYEAYERSLDASIHGMSLVSQRLLSLINYDEVKAARVSNFSFLQEQLGQLNQLPIILDKDDVPFAYPFLPEKLIDKAELYRDQLFVPTLWADPLKRGGTDYQHDKHIAAHLLPLPIDHRYNTEDMKRMTGKILELLK